MACHFFREIIFFLFYRYYMFQIASVLYRPNIHIYITCDIRLPSPNVNFVFSFPADEERRNRWLSFLNRNGINQNELKPSSRLCSLHFDPQDLTGTENRRHPAFNAYPTIDVMKVVVVPWTNKSRLWIKIICAFCFWNPHLKLLQFWILK